MCIAWHVYVVVITAVGRKLEDDGTLGKIKRTELTGAPFPPSCARFKLPTILLCLGRVAHGAWAVKVNQDSMRTGRLGYAHDHLRGDIPVKDTRQTVASVGLEGRQCVCQGRGRARQETHH